MVSSVVSMVVSTPEHGELGSTSDRDEPLPHPPTAAPPGDHPHASGYTVEFTVGGPSPRGRHQRHYAVMAASQRDHPRRRGKQTGKGLRFGSGWPSPRVRGADSPTSSSTRHRTAPRATFTAQTNHPRLPQSEQGAAWGEHDGKSPMAMASSAVSNSSLLWPAAINSDRSDRGTNTHSPVNGPPPRGERKFRFALRDRPMEPSPQARGEVRGSRRPRARAAGVGAGDRRSADGTIIETGTAVP